MDQGRDVVVKSVRRCVRPAQADPENMWDQLGTLCETWEDVDALLVMHGAAQQGQGG